MGLPDAPEPLQCVGHHRPPAGITRGLRGAQQDGAGLDERPERHEHGAQHQVPVDVVAGQRSVRRAQGEGEVCPPVGVLGRPLVECVASRGDQDREPPLGRDVVAEHLGVARGCPHLIPRHVGLEQRGASDLRGLRSETVAEVGTDQLVGEADRAVGCDRDRSRGRRRVDEVGGVQRIETESGSHHRWRSCRSLQRHQPDQAEGGVRERVEPKVEDVAQAVRDVRADRLTAAGEARELDREHRDPTGGGDEVLDPLRRCAVLGQDAADVGVGDRTEPDDLQPGPIEEVSDPAVVGRSALGRSTAQQHRQRSVRECAHQLVDATARHPICPVDVVDGHHDRSLVEQSVKRR